MISVALLLALFLVAMAAWDLWRPIRDRQWRVIVVYGVLWLVGSTLAIAEASGVELPSISRFLIRVTRPLSRWVP
ncbi:MAG: hypothetical protein AB1609_04620 [Bacillota bacterium]